VTLRAKRRLYGLKHLAPLRAAAAPPRRPQPGRRPGRPSAALPRMADLASDGGRLADSTTPLAPSPSLPPLARREFDFSAIDQWLDLADQAIRRVEQVLEQQQSRPVLSVTS